MKRIVVITPPDSRNGFACCGAVQQVAAPGEAVQTLQRALADPESGVVILDERLLEEVGEEQVKIWEEHWSGVLVVLPSPEGGGEVEDYATRLIRRAVGYHVRVRT